MPVVICPVCNYVVPNTAQPCPSCGNLVSTPAGAGLPVSIPELPSYPPKKIDNWFSRWAVFALLVGVVLAVVGGVAFYFVSSAQLKQKEEAKTQAVIAERLRQESDIEKFNEYVDLLNFVATSMARDSIVVEAMTNMIAKIWYNAIQNKDDALTDPYTHTNAYSTNTYRTVDFNTALSNFFQDDNTKQLNSIIELKRDVIKEAMRDLQSPPEECKYAYDSIIDLYRAYSTLVTLALTPTGTLQSFRDAKSSAMSSFISAHQQLETQIPKKRELLSGNRR